MGASAITIELAAAFSARAAAYRAAQVSRRETSRRSPKPYARVYFPGLRDAIMLNACRHAASRAFARSRPTLCAPPRRRLGVGKGEPPTGWRAVRKARCASLRRLARLPSRKESLPRLKPPSPVDCIPQSLLPDDVRRMRAAHFRFSRSVRPIFPRPPPRVWRPPLCTLLSDASGYRQHVARAAAGLQERARGLQPQGCGEPRKEEAVSVELAAEAAAAEERYAGRPDELYRRRMGKRFAAYRRERRTRAERAEAEMRRRRGGDRTKSERCAEDTSLVPFAFEQADGAFCFSRSITQAPRLRRTMLAKYGASRPQAVARPLDGMAKAKMAAEEKALFHTRVHNRFA